MSSFVLKIRANLTVLINSAAGLLALQSFQVGKTKKNGDGAVSDTRNDWCS